MKLINCLSLFLISGCAWIEKKPTQKQTLCLSNETIESSQVKWVKKKSSVARCKFLQSVEVVYCDGTIAQRTLYHLQVLKAKVADAKGNVLQLEDPNGTASVEKIEGNAYLCPLK